MISNLHPKKIRGNKTNKDFIIFRSKVLGQGSFGKVYRGSDSFGKEVAIKEFLKGGDEQDIYIQSLAQSTMATKANSQKTEADALAMFNHPNIIQLIDTANDEDTFYMILELCDGSLEKLIQQKDGKWTEEDFLKIIFDITNGLYFIHAQNCMHRDLKPANILMKEGRCKIADFGLISAKNKTDKFVGTQAYMAPEIVDNKLYGKEIDIYSLGKICFEIMGDNKFSKEIVQLNIQMVSEIPDKRPSIKYIVLKLALFMTKDKTKKLFLQNEIDNLLKEESREKEQLNKVRTEENKEKAFSSKDSNWSSEVQCFSCKGYGHYANVCPITGGYKSSVTCYKCGEIGHYANQCTNGVGYSKYGKLDHFADEYDDYDGPDYDYGDYDDGYHSDGYNDHHSGDIYYDKDSSDYDEDYEDNDRW